MTSFFDKLSVKLSGDVKPQANKKTLDTKKPLPAQPAPASTTAQDDLESKELGVDIYQDSHRIIIYALAAGVDPGDFEVLLDEENDALTIRGARKRPERVKDAMTAEELAHKNDPTMRDLDGKFIQEECEWVPFYRRIILPVEVDVVEAEAVFKKGVLIITLPILKLTQGRKLSVVEEPSVVPHHEA